VVLSLVSPGGMWKRIGRKRQNSCVGIKTVERNSQMIILVVFPEVINITQGIHMASKDLQNTTT